MTSEPQTLDPAPKVRAKPDGVFSLSELRRNPPAPVEFLVPDLIPMGLTLLAAKPKIGKSYLALQLCLAVATGDSFLEEEARRGDVLYLSLEDNRSRLYSRSLAMEEGESGESDIDFMMEAPRAGSGLLEVLEEWLDAVDDPRLIVIDTMAEILPGTSGRKSEYQHATDVLRPLQRLAAERNIAILLIHHTNKNQEAPDVFDQITGTTGYAGVADTLMVIERVRGDNQATMRIVGRDVEDDLIHLERQGAMWARAGTPPPAALRLTPEQKEVLQTVASGNDKPASVATALGKEPATVSKLMVKLRDKEMLTSSSYGKYELTDLGKQCLPAGRSGGSGRTPDTTTDDAPTLHSEDLLENPPVALPESATTLAEIQLSSPTTSSGDSGVPLVKF